MRKWYKHYFELSDRKIKKITKFKKFEDFEKGMGGYGSTLVCFGRPLPAGSLAQILYSSIGGGWGNWGGVSPVPPQ